MNVFQSLSYYLQWNEDRNIDNIFAKPRMLCLYSIITMFGLHAYNYKISVSDFLGIVGSIKV